MKKNLLLIILSAIVLSGCNNSDKIVNADVCVLSKQTISSDCVINGTIIYSSNSEVINSDISDVVVEKLYVKKGDFVEKGDAICTLDTSSLSSEADSIRKKISASEQKINNDKSHCQAALTHAKSSMEAELSYINNEIEEKRKMLNYNNTECSKAETEYADLLEKTEDAKNRLDLSENPEDILINGELYSDLSAKADVKFAEIQAYKDSISSLENSIKESQYRYEKAKIDGELSVSQAEYELKQADSIDLSEEKTRLNLIEKVISNNTISAVKSGYISELDIKEGMVIYDKKIGEISSCNDLCIEMFIPDKYILNVKEGSKVNFSSSSFNDIDYSGEIQNISRYREENGFKAIVRIDDQRELYAGLTAAVIVKLNEQEVSAVPFSAVHNDEDGNSFVYIAVDEGDGQYTVQKTNVKTGVSNKEYIEIKSIDIHNDSYILTSKDGITEGQIISVNTEVSRNVGTD